MALSGINLSVCDGETVAILGPSGCGKTTLLRLVGGLLAPDAGTVEVFGSRPEPGPRIGFVFQSFRLLPWATVRRNVAFPLALQYVPAQERNERVLRHLDLVGLRGVADAYPSQLSGGMRQRVALARALVCEPDLLLMDEPFASVDAQIRQLMQIELMRILSLRNIPALFVTHSIDEAILLGDRIVLLGGKPGIVREIHDVTLPRPRDPLAIITEPEFLELRSRLWGAMRNLVVEEPGSEFFGRG